MLKIVHSTINKPTRKQRVRAICEQIKREQFIKRNSSEKPDRTSFQPLKQSS